MDLQIATLEDLIEELDLRQMKFLLVGIEPTNRKGGSTAHIGAAAASRHDLARLLRLARTALKRGNPSEQ